MEENLINIKLIYLILQSKYCEMGIEETGLSHHERYIGLIRPNTLLGYDLNMP